MGAKISEPQEGQKVKLVLNYKAKDHGRYGIVLKVNGENTIAHQHLNDFECRKWVLGPNDPPIAVLGYQVDGQPIAEEFPCFRNTNRKRGRSITVATWAPSAWWFTTNVPGRAAGAPSYSRR